jgi:hypothetical protein
MISATILDTIDIKTMVQAVIIINKIDSFFSGYVIATDNIYR